MFSQSHFGDFSEAEVFESQKLKLNSFVEVSGLASVDIHVEQFSQVKVLEHDPSEQPKILDTLLCLSKFNPKTLVNPKW